MFVTAGLDIRKGNSTVFPTADATVWDQNEDLYERAQKEIGLYENSLQLLHGNAEKDINALVGMIASSSDVTLLALELMESTLAAHAHSFRPLQLPADLHWETLGLDVCDINGFFSYLDMMVEKSDPMQLFREEQLLDAYALSEVANLKIPKHRPFVVVRLKKLLVGH